MLCETALKLWKSAVQRCISLGLQPGIRFLKKIEHCFEINPIGAWLWTYQSYEYFFTILKWKWSIMQAEIEVRWRYRPKLQGCHLFFYYFHSDGVFKPPDSQQTFSEWRCEDTILPLDYWDDQNGEKRISLRGRDRLRSDPQWSPDRATKIRDFVLLKSFENFLVTLPSISSETWEM